MHAGYYISECVTIRADFNKENIVESFNRCKLWLKLWITSTTLHIYSENCDSIRVHNSISLTGSLR